MDYFSFVASEMAHLLNRILKQESGGLFHRPPQVVLGLTNGSDYALTLGGNIQLEQDKGTFTSRAGNDKFMVFRNPGKITLPFFLTGQGSQTLSAYDRLMSYFFDHRSIEPFIPEHYKSYPGLFERLSGQRAELRLRDQESLSIDYLSFSFDYSALYHSGNFVREEQKTKQRVIDLKSDSFENERRIP